VSINLTVTYGQAVRVQAEFRDKITGALVDPTDVYFQYKSQALGVPTTLHYGVDLALVRTGTGQYYSDIDTNPADGLWTHRFYSTGSYASAQDGEFFVRPNPVISNTPRTDPTTFANLPAASSGNEGAIRPITDSTTTTWGATITGGGSNHVLAYCNGTNWTVMAK
jgi:hypothetical protein